MAVAAEKMRASSWPRALGVSGGMLLASLLLARGTSSFIGARFPDRLPPADLLFETLPLVPWTQYITDIVQIVQLALVIWYVSRGRIRQLPEMIAMFSIMELLRSALNVLTPLGGPLGNGAFYGLLHVIQNGEFPSGHVATSFLFFLFIDAEEAPRLRATMLALVVLECVTLLLSRGHYSVDIVGGLLLSYFVFYEWKNGKLFNWLKPLVSLD